MGIDSLLTWSNLALLGIVVILGEVVLLFRILWLTHQLWWKYLFLLIPLGMSYWSFMVVQNALGVYRFLIAFPRLSPATYIRLLTLFGHAAAVCQVQAGILGGVFVLLLIIEKGTLPRVRRTPVWVLRKSSFLY